MKRLLPPLALAIAAIPLSAQEGEPKTRPAIPLLIRGAAPAPADAPRPAGAFGELSQEFDTAQRAWSTGYRAAAQKGEAEMRAYLADNPNPQQGFVPRFAAGAKEHAGTPEAVPFLVWLARHDSRDAAQHLTTLIEHHVEDPAIRGVLPLLAWRGDQEAAIAALDRVVEHAKDEGVKLAAIYTRAQRRMSSDDEADRELGKVDLQTVIGGSDTALAARAKSDLFELENLQVGMVAPDIEGEDLDGVPFKLSDYRGKVVVLDFWGDW